MQISGRTRDRALDAESVGTLLVLLSFVVLVCLLSFHLNVWIDESYSLATTSGDLGSAFERALSFENQAPLYFVLLRLWRFVDDSAFFARLLSVLATLGLLVVLARLAGGGDGKPSALLPVAYAATCPVVVWAAVEIRLYALALLLGLLLMVTFDAAFARGEWRWGAVVGHAALVLSSLYTYYFLGFLLLGNLATLAAAGRWGQAFRYGLVLAVCLLLVLPVLWWTVAELEQVERAVTDVEMTLSLPAAARLIGEKAEESVVSAFPVWQSLGWRASGPLTSAVYWGIRLVLVGALLLSLGSVEAVKRLLLDRHVQLAICVLVALWLQLSGVVSTSQAVAATVRNDSLALTRHSSLLIVPWLVLLVYIGRHADRRAIFNAALAALVALNGVALVQSYRPLAKEGNSKRVARFLERVEGESEPVLVFPPEEVLPLRYHYRGRNRLVPIPREPSLERYEPLEYIVHEVSEVERAVVQGVAGAGALWLVHNESFRQCCGRLDVGGDIVAAYVEKEFLVEWRERLAKGVVVSRLLRR